jgi:hypothetical protein
MDMEAYENQQERGFSMADDPVFLNLHESREGRLGTISAIGRSQGRRRSRWRPRGRVQGGALTSSLRGGVTKGWRLKNVTESLQEEREVVDVIFSERARLFCSFGVERLDELLQCGELPGYRAGIIELFTGDLLALSRQWINEKIVRDGTPFDRVTESDMLRYVAVLTLSHCTGFSLTRSLELLLLEGIYAPSLERVRFISTNILACCPSGRGNQGRSNWQCSRDQTQSLTELEKAAYKTSCRILLTPIHTYSTLHDELYGARATDNQVKILSARKADREGHCADAIADALFGITWFVRFRRRGHKQTENVNQVLNCILESRGEQSFHGYTITADRGYENMALVKQLLNHDIGAILVMPDNLIACHPFVGKSYFKLGRDEDDEESADNGEEGETNDVSEDDVQTGESQFESFSISQFDKPRAFVLDDDPSMERACFYCKQSFQRGNDRSRTQITAAEVREHGTQKFSKILGFMYRLSPSVSRLMEAWIAVPGSGSGGTTLFTRRDDNGRFITPGEDAMECIVLSSVSLLEDITQIILTLSEIAPFVGNLVNLGAGRDTDLHFAAHLAMCIYV